MSQTDAWEQLSTIEFIRRSTAETLDLGRGQSVAWRIW